MEKRTSLPVLMTPLGASFNCSTCGDCCRGWDVHVDLASHQAISDALSRRPGGITAAEAFVVPAHREPHVHAHLRRRPDGACIFLEPDNLCYLHRHFGPEVKPPTCRTYPFRPVLRPMGVVAPAALSCTSLRRSLRGLSGPLAQALVSVDQPALAELAYDRYAPGSFVRLGKGRLLQVESQHELEQHLLGQLHDPGRPLGTRLLSMRRLVEDLVFSAAPGQDRIPAAAVTHRIEARPAAAAPQPDMEQHVLSLREVLTWLPQRDGRLLRRQASLLGLHVNLPLRKRAEIAACMYHVRYPADEGDLLPLITTYLGERLLASNLTMRYGFRSTVQAVVLAAALIRFFACGVAGERYRAVTRDDLAQAIEEVDVLFFHTLTALEHLRDGEEEALSVRRAEILAIIPPSP
jgi:Fe-S-cluster containining protein